MFVRVHASSRSVILVRPSESTHTLCHFEMLKPTPESLILWTAV